MDERANPVVDAVTDSDAVGQPVSIRNNKRYCHCNRYRDIDTKPISERDGNYIPVCSDDIVCDVVAGYIRVAVCIALAVDDSFLASDT